MRMIDRKFMESRLKAHLATRTDSNEDAIRQILEKIESVDWNIESALVDVVPAIEDKKARNSCRRILVARLYGAAEEYNLVSQSYQSYLDHVSDNCVLMQNRMPDGPSSTTVLYPDGKVRIQPGKLWVNGRSLSWPGLFNAFDAQDNRKMGLLYRDGRYLVPCIFDYVDNDLSGPAIVYSDYVGFCITFYDKPYSEILRNKEFKIGDNLYVGFSCHGLKMEHSYSDSLAVPLYDGDPMTDEQEREYVKQVKERVFSLLDLHFARYI